MASKTLQGEEEFHSKNHLLEMPFSHAKMCLKSAPQKLSFVMTKAVSKSYTLDYSCKYSGKFPDSTYINAVSFLNKTIIYETSNIFV